MSELFKTIVDLKQRKKFESERAYAKVVAIMNSTHTEQEIRDATREYFEASSAFLAVNEVFVSLLDKGLI